jgi:hypothetical protein
MATREQVRSMQTAQPFRPFTVTLADGRSFRVTHPENVACSLNGREMALFDEQGMHLLEMLLVAEIIRVPESAPTDGEGA